MPPAPAFRVARRARLLPGCLTGSDYAPFCTPLPLQARLAVRPRQSGLSGLELTLACSDVERVERAHGDDGHRVIDRISVLLPPTSLYTLVNTTPCTSKRRQFLDLLNLPCLPFFLPPF